MGIKPLGGSEPPKKPLSEKKPIDDPFAGLVQEALKSMEGPPPPKSIARPIRPIEEGHVIQKVEQVAKSALPQETPEEALQHLIDTAKPIVITLGSEEEYSSACNEAIEKMKLIASLLLLIPENSPSYLSGLKHYVKTYMQGIYDYTLELFWKWQADDPIHFKIHLKSLIRILEKVCEINHPIGFRNLSGVKELLDVLKQQEREEASLLSFALFEHFKEELLQPLGMASATGAINLCQKFLQDFLATYDSALTQEDKYFLLSQSIALSEAKARVLSGRIMDLITRLKQIQNDIDQLTPGKFLWIAGGTAKHAVIYRITCISNDEYYFEIIDTSVVSELPHLKRFPITVFLTPSQIKDDLFLTLLISREDESFSDTLEKISMALNTPLKLVLTPKAPIKPQRWATCSYSSLMAALKTALPAALFKALKAHILYQSAKEAESVYKETLDQLLAHTLSIKASYRLKEFYSKLRSCMTKTPLQERVERTFDATLGIQILENLTLRFKKPSAYRDKSMFCHFADLIGRVQRIGGNVEESLRVLYQNLVFVLGLDESVLNEQDKRELDLLMAEARMWPQPQFLEHLSVTLGDIQERHRGE